MKNLIRSIRLRLAEWLARGADHVLVSLPAWERAIRVATALNQYAHRSGHLQNRDGGSTRARVKVLGSSSQIVAVLVAGRYTPGRPQVTSEPLAQLLETDT